MIINLILYVLWGGLPIIDVYKRQHQVRVAFNHDFFSYEAGVCIGLNISEGEIDYGSGWGRSLLAINKDKKAGVFYPVLSSSLIFPDQSKVCLLYTSRCV